MPGYAAIRTLKNIMVINERAGQRRDRVFAYVPDGRPLADFLPTLAIKAKDFANEVTNTHIREQDLHGENDISCEHVRNNQDVRKILTDRNIGPEALPPAEDVKKIERRLKSEEKKLPRLAAPRAGKKRT